MRDPWVEVSLAHQTEMFCGCGKALPLAAPFLLLSRLHNSPRELCLLGLFMLVWHSPGPRNARFFALRGEGALGCAIFVTPLTNALFFATLARSLKASDSSPFVMVSEVRPSGAREGAVEPSMHYRLASLFWLTANC